MGASVVKYSDLEMQDLLGKGAFSEVYRAKRRSGGSEYYAVKKIDLRDKSRAVMASEEARNIQKVSGHKNIVKYFCKDIDEGLCCIVLEYCNEGDLNNYCLNGPSTSKVKLAQFCQETASGLNHMHKLDVPHGDLKPGNILIHNGTCKISDLEFSSTVELILGARDGLRQQSAKNFFTNQRPPFWSPEALRRLGEGNNQERPSPRTLKEGDIFSMGLIFLVLFSNQILLDGTKKVLAPMVSDDKVYGDSTQAEILTAVHESPATTEGMPNSLLLCLLKMLRVNPSERITSSDVCNELH